jgi:hypothetical protein
VHQGRPRRAEVHRLHQVEHGDRLVKRTGGGVGNPAELDPETREVDWPETERLRERGGGGVRGGA